ncbi:MAG: PAS domain-containing protein [Candidatus Azotimanducaceae bacterium]|jgi:PAS domain-containing protein
MITQCLSTCSGIDEVGTQLQQSQGFANAVLDNAVEAIITIDSIGTIESINRAAHLMFGYSTEEIITTHRGHLMFENLPAKGAIDFIRKPFREQDLLDRINDALSLGSN